MLYKGWNFRFLMFVFRFNREALVNVLDRANRLVYISSLRLGIRNIASVATLINWMLLLQDLGTYLLVVLEQTLVSLVLNISINLLEIFVHLFVRWVWIVRVRGLFCALLIRLLVRRFVLQIRVILYSWKLGGLEGTTQLWCPQSTDPFLLRLPC